MLRILFPFYGRYPKLSAAWWHRCAVAVFFLLLAGTFVHVYSYLHNVDESKWSLCYQQAQGMYDSKPDTLLDYLQTVCSTNGKVANYPKYIGFGLLALVGMSYLLQVIYYRGLLYLVFGRGLRRFAK